MINLKQKKQLRNQLKSKLSNYNLSIGDIEKIDTNNRKKVVYNKVLEIKIVALDWALENNVVQKNELTTNKYFVNDYKLSELITSSGLLVAGGAGSAIAVSATTAAMAGTGLAGGLGVGFLGTAAANVGLGTVATTGVAAGAATVAVAIAPVALAGAGIYAIIRYRKNKELVQNIKNEFEQEKVKILNFYLSKINIIKSAPISKQEKVIIKEEEKYSSKKKQQKIQQNTTIQAVPASKESKTVVKKVEKDIDYDKCIVTYDDKLKICSIKHEGNIRGKKNGLHGKTFKSFVHKIPPIIDDIFNSSQAEIIFIGSRIHLTELKNACKAFEESDNISIKISFRDITEKV